MVQKRNRPKKTKWDDCIYIKSGAYPATKVGGVISVTFGSQVSLQVPYCKRDEAYFTILL